MYHLTPPRLTPPAPFSQPVYQNNVNKAETAVLPPAMDRLCRLEALVLLNVSFCSLTSLPRLPPSLVTLKANDNALVEIGDLSECAALESLLVRKNKLFVLDGSLAKCAATLTALDVSENKFEVSVRGRRAIPSRPISPPFAPPYPSPPDSPVVDRQQAEPAQAVRRVRHPRLDRTDRVRLFARA